MLISFVSCTKSENSLDTSNSQDKLYAWFIDNGWYETIFEYGNPCNANSFYMGMDASGNIVGETFNSWGDYSSLWFDYRLYSTFDQVKELSDAPVDGFTDIFVCETNKCGVTRRVYLHNGTSYFYFKFYVERINSSQMKVFYKEWYPK